MWRTKLIANNKQIPQFFNIWVVSINYLELKRKSKDVVRVIHWPKRRPKDMQNIYLAFHFTSVFCLKVEAFDEKTKTIDSISNVKKKIYIYIEVEISVSLSLWHSMRDHIARLFGTHWFLKINRYFHIGRSCNRVGKKYLLTCRSKGKVYSFGNSQ